MPVSTVAAHQHIAEEQDEIFGRMSKLCVSVRQKNESRVRMFDIRL